MGKTCSPFAIVISPVHLRLPVSRRSQQQFCVELVAMCLWGPAKITCLEAELHKHSLSLSCRVCLPPTVLRGHASANFIILFHSPSLLQSSSSPCPAQHHSITTPRASRPPPSAPPSASSLTLYHFDRSSLPPPAPTSRSSRRASPRSAAPWLSTPLIASRHCIINPINPRSYYTAALITPPPPATTPIFPYCLVAVPYYCSSSFHRLCHLRALCPNL
ncbi:hypothetical protein PtB15_5B503 [Puccinia triticina]|nr:hypothetical protein PtB15_5B503 [Puccinia triticina]